ncbi:MAG: bifunctional diaminohydroxyphosphoribosylaminopyrimidine deaminase/5-amino-6-(5-phosphoribosylamino)uracil reductase RibD [Phycisphaerales bacterium]|nr:bifunctional diaminohydroxyphosphoribosylaminopyrimidine deaminase/5-amino-6-(5-phosphoribosylamino)uracil reductase RibD [Phycisphaerales bacterium]
MTRDDKKMLDLAARLAFRAAGYVEPNPMVGCVIARDGAVLGMGHHRRFGGPHAEVEAINDCVRLGNQTRGATAYVTLEPCAHMGKQPPCVDALFSAGIARVVCARRDPDPRAAGGAEQLAASGVACEFTSVSSDATHLSDPFVKRVRTGLPWVIAKWAQTIDGRVATRTGESKWISCEASRRRVHRLRARVDAVVTAIGTILSDDPILTARGGWTRRRVARRVVIDPGLEIPENALMVQTLGEAPLTIVCADESLRSQSAKVGVLTALGAEVISLGMNDEVDVEAILRHLSEVHEATNVLVEAGPGLLGRLFDADLVDEAHVYIAPKLLADESAKPAARGRVAERLSDAKVYGLERVKRIEDDVWAVYRRVMEP